MKQLRTNTLLTMAVALCLLGASIATAQQVAQVDVGENGVVWHPQSNDKLVLTVSGPGGDFRQEFGVGEKPAMDVFNKDGALLADGPYTWQLVTLPTVGAETRAAMQKSRDEGTPFVGTLPQSFSQSGTLHVKGGYFVLPNQESQAPVDKPAQVIAPNKDQVINDDLIVTQSACIGQDCTNGESFGFDTLRLKENNLRIKFQDTSNSASFPTNDWQLTANDSDNGGANKFSIDDIDGGRTPFTIEASAPSHSLYVDDGGRIGLGTSTPVVELHMPSGDTPTVRLEQDGSSGFTPQTWDMAGNETNFFIRDATNGSRLPFKIRPSAPTNSLYVDTDGDIGLQTASPSAALHLVRSNGTARLFVEENDAAVASSALIDVDSASSSGTVSLVNMTASGGARPRMTMTHVGAGSTWNWDILNVTGNFALIQAGGPTYTFESSTGDLEIGGNFVANVPRQQVPDFVFSEDYDLMPLDEVKDFVQQNSHLPEIPSAEKVSAEGLHMTDMQLKLLQKVEELTLYTIDQHETIQSQQDTIQQLMERLEALESAQR